MGIVFSITCRNKACRYHVQLREGSGFSLFRITRNLERGILSGSEEAADEIKALLESGHELQCVATYLCPKCQEWQVGRYHYILERIKVSPYGTIREYKIHFLNGTPKCKKCNTELEFILNPKSPKNKCPKCGVDNMKVTNVGFYD